MTASKEQSETQRRKLLESQRPLLWALSDIGIQVESVWDLVNSTTPDEAIPILTRHLQRDYMFRVKEGIARSLITKNAGREAMEALVAEFKQVPGTQDQLDRYSYKVALGFAIGALAKKTDFDLLTCLIRDNNHGMARVGLIRALPRKDRVRSGDVLISVLDQRDVAVFAIDGLAYLRDPRPRETIEALASSVPSKDPDGREFHRVVKKYLKRVS